MKAKVIAAVITLIINVAAGTVVFFGLLLALNGYSESDATWGLITYLVLAVIVSVTMTVLAATSVHLLMKRGISALMSAVLAVLAFSIIGAVLKFVCSLVGVAVVEFMRVNY